MENIELSEAKQIVNDIQIRLDRLTRMYPNIKIELNEFSVPYNDDTEINRYKIKAKTETILK